MQPGLQFVNFALREWTGVQKRISEIQHYYI